MHQSGIVYKDIKELIYKYKIKNISIPIQSKPNSIRSTANDTNSFLNIRVKCEDDTTYVMNTLPVTLLLSEILKQIPVSLLK